MKTSCEFVLRFNDPVFPAFSLLTTVPRKYKIFQAFLNLIELIKNKTCCELWAVRMIYLIFDRGSNENILQKQTIRDDATWHWIILRQFPLVIQKKMKKCFAYEWK